MIHLSSKKVNLAALLVGTVLLPFVTSDPMRVWALFALVTVCHVIFNYCAVRAVVLETLNEQRLALLLDGHAVTGRWASPKEIAAKERLFYRGIPGNARFGHTHAALLCVP